MASPAVPTPRANKKVQDFDLMPWKRWMRKEMIERQGG
jgi:hypothetical protein